MNVLITGVSGFLGSNLAHQLRKNHTIIGAYRSQPVTIPGVTMAQLDLSDRQTLTHLIGQYKPSVVIHCAAQANLERAEADPDEANRSNRIGTGTLIEALPKKHLFHLHLNGTCL